MAKIIQDEINQDKIEIKNNINYINNLIDNYLNSMVVTLGNNLIYYLYIINILHFLNKSIHFQNFNKNKMILFLENYDSELNELFNIKKILDLIYLNKLLYKEEIKSDHDLALNLLYQKILLSSLENRKKEILVDYYIKQKKLENMDFSSVSSNKAKLDLLKIAIILKAINGKGLYLPELEKEQYLSKYSQELIQDKYKNILYNLNMVEIYKYNINAWKIILIFFILEIIVKKYPSFFGLSLLFLSIDLSFISNFKIEIILLLNGLIITTFLSYLNHKTKKKLGEISW